MVVYNRLFLLIVFLLFGLTNGAKEKEKGSSSDFEYYEDSDELMEDNVDEEELFGRGVYFGEGDDYDRHKEESPGSYADDDSLNKTEKIKGFIGDKDSGRSDFDNKILGITEIPNSRQSSSEETDDEKRKDKEKHMIFSSKKNFLCPKIKSDLVTGQSVGDVSPEDIRVIASMGDSLSTGGGLWPKSDVEFRGAAFSIGGDATIDGLVTIPNILREFNPKLIGASHGIGTRDELPSNQLNVAMKNADASSLPAQAGELVRRIWKLKDTTNDWIMVIITIGSDSTCRRCIAPDYNAMLEAITILERNLHNALVVVVGPIHVTKANVHDQNEKLLRKRCICYHQRTDQEIHALVSSWTSAIERLQKHFDNMLDRRPTFGVLALPLLTITSRFPHGLFLPKGANLNRRGNNYATKWLWNRMVVGETYNVSTAQLSTDDYRCPSTGCPYFRTTANKESCQLLSISEAKEKELTLTADGRVIKKPRRTPALLYRIAIILPIICFISVCTFGIIFYCMSKQGTRKRFEDVSPGGLQFEPVEKEEERKLKEKKAAAVVQRSDTLRTSTRRLTTSINQNLQDLQSLL